MGTIDGPLTVTRLVNSGKANNIKAFDINLINLLISMKNQMVSVWYTHMDDSCM